MILSLSAAVGTIVSVAVGVLAVGIVVFTRALPPPPRNRVW